MVDYTNPKDMTDDDIDQRYRDIWHRSVGSFKHDAEASLLAIEINRRFVEDTARGSHRWVKISIGVSFFALIFAFTSAIFSYIDWHEDSVWQKQQIELLHKINDQINALQPVNNNKQQKHNKSSNLTGEKDSPPS